VSPRWSSADRYRPGEPLLVTAREIEETPGGWLLSAGLMDASVVRLALAMGETVRRK